MNIRNISLLGSLFFSGLLTLGACGSSSSSPGTGGTTGSLGGTTGSLAGTTGSFGGSTGATGGHVVAAGGTTGSAGGTTGSAGGTTGAAGGSTGTCTVPVPSCLQALVSCGTVSGTCVQQMTGSVASGMYGFNTCYGNGVKHVSTITVDPVTSAVSVTVTASKGGSVCYTESETQTDPNQTNAPVTIKNGAGTTVAMLMDSADGTATVVTCTGAAPVTIPNDCMLAGTGMTTTSDCTDGVCQ